ncbi:hypothetical protein HDU76_007054 [Blyttiomyces sp. JEL0837]|nr:hypothetical protein HDU76_007054 [Blyttiomyces sp. JEL0837]
MSPRPTSPGGSSDIMMHFSVTSNHPVADRQRSSAGPIRSVGPTSHSNLISTVKPEPAEDGSADSASDSGHSSGGSSFTGGRRAGNNASAQKGRRQRKPEWDKKYEQKRKIEGKRGHATNLLVHQKARCKERYSDSILALVETLRNVQPEDGRTNAMFNRQAVERIRSRVSGYEKKTWRVWLPDPVWNKFNLAKTTCCPDGMNVTVAEFAELLLDLAGRQEGGEDSPNGPDLSMLERKAVTDFNLRLQLSMAEYSMANTNIDLGSDSDTPSLSKLSPPLEAIQQQERAAFNDILSSLHDQQILSADVSELFPAFNSIISSPPHTIDELENILGDLGDSLLADLNVPVYHHQSPQQQPMMMQGYASSTSPLMAPQQFHMDQMRMAAPVMTSSSAAPVSISGMVTPAYTPSMGSSLTSPQLSQAPSTLPTAVASSAPSTPQPNLYFEDFSGDLPMASGSIVTFNFDPAAPYLAPLSIQPYNPDADQIAVGFNPIAWTPPTLPGQYATQESGHGRHHHSHRFHPYSHHPSFRDVDSAHPHHPFFHHNALHDHDVEEEKKKVVVKISAESIKVIKHVIHAVKGRKKKAHHEEENETEEVQKEEDDVVVPSVVEVKAEEEEKEKEVHEKVTAEVKEKPSVAVKPVHWATHYGPSDWSQRIKTQPPHAPVPEHQKHYKNWIEETKAIMEKMRHSDGEHHNHHHHLSQLTHLHRSQTLDGTSSHPHHHHHHDVIRSDSVDPSTTSTVTSPTTEESSGLPKRSNTLLGSLRSMLSSSPRPSTLRRSTTLPNESDETDTPTTEEPQSEQPQPKSGSPVAASVEDIAGTGSLDLSRDRGASPAPSTGSLEEYMNRSSMDDVSSGTSLQKLGRTGSISRLFGRARKTVAAFVAGVTSSSSSLASSASGSLNQLNVPVNNTAGGKRSPSPGARSATPTTPTTPTSATVSADQKDSKSLGVPGEVMTVLRMVRPFTAFGEFASTDSLENGKGKGKGVLDAETMRTRIIVIAGIVGEMVERKKLRREDVKSCMKYVVSTFKDNPVPKPTVDLLGRFTLVGLLDLNENAAGQDDEESHGEAWEVVEEVPLPV